MITLEKSPTAKYMTLLLLFAHPKMMQQINFTGNLHQTGNTVIFFVTKEAKETIIDFSQETVGVM